MGLVPWRPTVLQMGSTPASVEHRLFRALLLWYNVCAELVGSDCGDSLTRKAVTVFDPDYCEKKCPVCTKAREGNRFAQLIQTVEMAVTFGGCPYGRARQKKYGVKPNQPLPSDKK